LVGVYLRDVHALGYNTSHRSLAGTAGKIGSGVLFSVSGDATVDSVAVGLRIHHNVGVEESRVEGGGRWCGRREEGRRAEIDGKHTIHTSPMPETMRGEWLRCEN